MTVAQTEAEWIDWAGGECPVARGTIVDVQHADGEEYYGHAALAHSLTDWAASDWVFTGGDSDIVKYRVVVSQ